MVSLMFVMPVMQLFILGHAVSSDVRRLPVAVYDQDHTPASREFIQRLGSTDYFTIERPVTRRSEVRELLDHGDVIVAVAIPVGFERDLTRGVPVRVQIVVDGSNSSTASIALGYATRIAAAYGEDMRLRAAGAEASGASAAVLADTSGVASRPIRVDARVWYNPNLRSQDYMVPGVVVLLLTMVTTLLTSMGIVREREVGTLEQLLVTPIRTWELMLGKLLPFAVLGLVNFSFSLLVAKLMFRIPIAGNLAFLYGCTVLFLFTTLGMGLFVSTISTTQQQAMFLGWFFNIFFIMMSGFFYPISNMPRVLQYVSYADPLRYYMVVMREVLLKGGGFAELRAQIAALAIFGVAILTLASLRFQKRLG
jgi:ABC-2 type transport system permease protein